MLSRVAAARERMLDYAPGAFCRVGLAISDPAGAKAFYASLFGWQNEDLPAGELDMVTTLRRDGREVAILYRQTREARAARAAPHWTPFVSVEDVDASVLRAPELGGVVLREPLELGDAGRVAALRDPLGGVLSLWEANAHAGAELIDVLGALCWHELVTPEVERAKSFYGALLGWVFEAGASGLTTITNAGNRIGMMREQADRQGASERSWISFFGVESAPEAADRAERNGGQSVTGPADGPIGRTALLADPQGATFAVLELRSQR